MKSSGDAAELGEPSRDADESASDGENGGPGVDSDTADAPLTEFLRVERRLWSAVGLLYAVEGFLLAGVALLVHFDVIQVDFVLEPDGLAPVLALSSALAIALHVGIYNLEKDKEGAKASLPNVVARYRVFETCAILCASIAAVTGLLAAFHDPGTWAVTGLLQLVGSFVVVLMAVVALDIIPEPVRDTSKRTVIGQRLGRAEAALEYWDGASGGRGAATPMAARKAWRLILLVVVATVLPRAVGAVWIDSGGVWAVAASYWAMMIVVAVLLLRSYIEGDWAYIVMFGIGGAGFALIFGATCWYDVTQADHPWWTLTLWAVPLVLLMYRVPKLLRPNVGSGPVSTGVRDVHEDRRNGVLPSLCSVWLTAARDRAKGNLGLEDAEESGVKKETRWRLIELVRVRREKWAAWHGRATGRVAMSATPCVVEKQLEPAEVGKA